LKNRWLAALLLLIVASASPVFAQGGAGGSTGSIQGEVTDDSGGVLPGVTVTVTGTSMMGARTDTTNAQGVYRFLGLPAGTYAVKYELAGFGTVNKTDIRIGIGFTAKIPVKMGIKTLSDEVTVTENATAIDVTATRVQTNFGKDQLDSIPNARDMWSLLSTTPGIQLSRFDVGGATAGTQGTYVAYGNGGQNRPLIEGINTTEGTSASGFYFDYGSFDEVIVGAAGNSAEMPSGGVITNFIGKSGGNKLSGELYYEKEWQGLQGTNITPEQLAAGAANFAAKAIQTLGLQRNQGNTLIDYKNLNASLGGPLVKDKLWAWGGILRQENITYQPPAGAILDGTPFRTKLMNYTGKVTFQATSRDKLVAYVQYGIKQQPNRLDSAAGVTLHQTAASTVLQNSPSWVGKVEYNRTIGNRGFLEIRAGEFGYNFGQVSNGQDPRVEDTVTSVVTGGQRDWLLDRRRKQASGAYTFYLENVAGGNHQMKIGGEYQHELGEYIITPWGNSVSILNNGVPTAVRLYANVDSINGLDNQGLYVNDSYSHGRFTANLGVRFDNYKSFIPDQKRAPSLIDPVGITVAATDIKTFTHFVPRIGLIYDLSGNGKTVVKANYGRYYFNLGVGFAENVNPNGPGPGGNGPYRQYTWTDKNNNGRWDNGEQGTLTSDQLSTNPVFNPATAFDPNLKNSYTDELSFWLERQLPGNIGARVGYVWKMDRDGYQLQNTSRPMSAYNLPVTLVDPGRDGNAATTADNGVIQAFGFNGNIATTTNLLVNPPGFEANYKTVEVALNRRFSNKFSFTADYTITHTGEWTTSYFGSGSWGNAGSGASLFSGFGGAGFPLSPNDQKAQTDFWAYNFRAFGTYEPGWGIRLTPTLKIQQGYPYARAVSGSLNYGTQSFQAEPLGTFRMPTVTVVDIRAEKKFKLTQKVGLSVILDGYNLTNANTVINSNHATGLTTINESTINGGTAVRVPTFQSPTTILPPRIARVSARLSW